MSAIAIRAAQMSDLPSVNALMHGSSAYQGTYYAIIENYFVTGPYLAANKVYLAERDGELLGFYGLVLGAEPDLDLMFVSDAAQGSGVGRLLFEHMKSIARRNGVASVRIGSHPPAVGFYESMGAIRVGVSPPSGKISWERPVLKLELLES